MIERLSTLSSCSYENPQVIDDFILTGEITEIRRAKHFFQFPLCRSQMIAVVVQMLIAHNDKCTLKCIR